MENNPTPYEVRLVERNLGAVGQYEKAWRERLGKLLQPEGSDLNVKPTPAGLLRRTNK